MKKLVALLLVLTMVFALAACGGAKKDDTVYNLKFYHIFAAEEADRKSVV